MLDFHLLIFHERRLYVANPCISTITYTPADTPWTRPGAVQDVTASLSQHDAELLDTLSQSYAEHELSEVAQTLGMAREYVAWLAGQQIANETTFAENYFRTIFCAVTMEAIIERHGAVTTPAILGASLAELREWEPYYFSQLQEIHAQGCGIEEGVTSGDYSSNAAWALCRAKFARIAGFLLEVRMRLGLNVFTGALSRAKD